MKRIVLVLLSAGLLLGSLYAGDGERVFSQVDELAAQTADELNGLFRRTERETTVLSTGINFQNQETPLGDYFTAQLISYISRSESPLIPIASPRILEQNRIYIDGNEPEYDILVYGQIFIEEMAFIQIQIVEASTGKILGVVDTDLYPSTEFYRQLESVGGGSSLMGSRFEPDNSPDQSNRLNQGEGYANLSLDTDDEDWFSFTMEDVDEETPIVLTVWTEGSTDTYMEVYGPDSPYEILTQNDDFNGGNAQVSFMPEPGREYWIKVRGYSSSTTGEYSLYSELEVAEVDRFEPNNNLDQAIFFAPEFLEEWMSISPAGDQDWFRVPSEEFWGSGNMLVLETLSELDLKLEVYDRYGEMIAQDDDSGEGNNARVIIMREGLGEEIFVKAFGFGSSVEGDYRLLVSSETIEPDDYEPDNNPEEARTIEINSRPQTHTFMTNSDEDWLSFVVRESGTRITAETRGDTDTYITLYDAEMNYIAGDDDSGNSYNAMIDERLDRGRYYIQVTPIGGADNSEYSIVLYD